MEAKLIVVGGKANKAEVPLKLPASVGRGRDSHLTIAHPTVSRHHCLVYELDGVLMVKDKGSLNGTYIDDERIDSDRILRPGQTLTIGPLTFRAEYELTDSSQDVLGDVPAADPSAGGGSAGAPPVTPAATSPPPPPPMPPLPPAIDAPETIHFAADGLNETTDLPPAASPAPLPAGSAEPADEDSGEFALPIDVEPKDAEPENESGRFDFLDDEPIGAAVAPAGPPALSDGESGEIFSFADEPPSVEEVKPGKNRPAEKKSQPSKSSANSKPSANGDSQRPSAAPPQINLEGAEPAPAVHQSDDDLNNFLDSLGLE